MVWDRVLTGTGCVLGVYSLRQLAECSSNKSEHDMVHAVPGVVILASHQCLSHSPQPPSGEGDSFKRKNIYLSYSANRIFG